MFLDIIIGMFVVTVLIMVTLKPLEREGRMNRLVSVKVSVPLLLCILLVYLT